MAYMSYCRWENTLNDLRDCAKHLNDPLGGSEARARASLLELAADMLEEVGVTINHRELDLAFISSRRESREALSNAPGGEG